ncbi:Fc.00g000980.m01.CDS01 [Cosmosporella sp. VM-42]
MLLSFALASQAIGAVVAQDILTCSSWLLGPEFGVVQPHHGHIDIIWNEMWRPLAIAQAVPFYDANVTDFDPIFAYLIQHSLSDTYDPAYTNAFLPTAANLVSQAEEAEKINNTKLAGELYTYACPFGHWIHGINFSYGLMADQLDVRRASAVLRIARYPNPVTSAMQDAWHKQVDAYFKSGKYLDPPVYPVNIPHTHAANGDGPTIPVAVRHPKTSSSNPRPVLLFVTGLDQFRPDFNPLTEWATSQGWEVVVVEIPGTGDSPSNRSDPVAGDRLWNSVFDWIDAQPAYDSSRLSAWCFSTGSYYGMRMAHTHADRLHAVVAQGGASHKAFEREWLLHMDGNENPFITTPSLIYKWGYEDLDDLLDHNQQDYSLILDGTFEKNSSSLLIVNGMHDGFFPAEDSLLPLNFGWPSKVVKLFPDQGHMGGEPGFELAQQWLRNTMEN